MAIRESLLDALNSIATSDFVRSVTAAGASSKVTVSNLAKTIVENYIGSTLAGSSQSVKSAIDALDTSVDALDSTVDAISDYIVEQGTSGIWTYRKWNSGISECWGTYSYSFTGFTAWGSLYYSTPSANAAFPSGLFNAAPTTQITRSGGTEGWAGLNSVTKTDVFAMYLIRPTTNPAATTQFHIHAIGKWK